MNPKKNMVCVKSGEFGFGSISGGKIKGYKASVSKHYPNGKIRKAEIDGKIFNSREELDRYGLEYGITHYYGRNIGGFVMSKAARKRGYTTDNRWYNRSQEHYKNRINS